MLATPTTQLLLAKAVGAAQLAVAAGVLAGEQVAPGLLPAETWAALRDKRGVILMGTWFLGNTLRNGFTSTGAFEVDLASSTGVVPCVLEGAAFANLVCSVVYALYQPC